MVAAGNEPSIANQRLLQYITWKEKERRDRARCKTLQMAAQPATDETSQLPRATMYTWVDFCRPVKISPFKATSVQNFWFRSDWEMPPKRPIFGRKAETENMRTRARLLSDAVPSTTPRKCADVSRRCVKKACRNVRKMCEYNALAGRKNRRVPEAWDERANEGRRRIRPRPSRGSRVRRVPKRDLENRNLKCEEICTTFRQNNLNLIHVFFEKLFNNVFWEIV